MGNKGIDEEDVLRYIREGWHFRTKTVKGRKYITRRKGQVERGMGPFDPELWAAITKVIQQTAGEETPSIQTGPVLDEGAAELSNGAPKRLSASEVFEMKWRRLQDKISMDRGVSMMLSCIHRDDEGFCSYWSWESNPNFFGLLDELMGSEMYEKKRISKNGLSVERWLVKALHWYCSSCPVYQPLRARRLV